MKYFTCLRFRQLNALIMAVCLITFLTGCQSGPYPITDPQTELQPVHITRVTIGPGDDIEIQFTYVPQFNCSRTVQRDGKIQLPLLEQGTVLVQGKTPSELQKELIELYSDHMRHPELIVITRSQYQDRVYVGGEVKEPGLLEFPGHMTALEAIMRSGGFDMRSAQVKNIIVIRHKDGQRYGCLLNFKDALAGREAQPFYLEPYDIVWVPRTFIFKANQWIDQYINKVVPQTGFLYEQYSGDHTIGIRTDAYNVR